MATNSIDFKVKNGLIVSSTASIRGTTESISTQSGALVVDGGAAVAKNLHVGGTITGSLTGTADFANDLNGGATGSIPYQSTANNTTFLAIGANNYVLASNGTEPAWASLNSLGAGSATTATNIAGGTAGQVPYQTGPGATAFFGPGTAGQLLISDGASSPLYTNTSTFKVGSADAADKWTTARTITLAGDLSGNVDIDGTTNVTLTATINANSVALGTDTTGIYVASAATSGLGLSGSANTEGSTFTVNSNATSSNSTSTIVFRDETGGFYANTLNLQGTTQATSTQTGTLLVSGGAGIGGNVYIGGNLQFETAANQTAGLYNDEATGRLIFGMVDNSNIYGAYFSVFGNQWNDTTQRGGAEFVVDTRNSTTKGFTLGRFDGASWTSDFKMDVSGNFTLTGITYLTNTTNSDSTLTGALVLSGGAAIAKNLTVGGSLNLLDATNSINTSSGSLTLAGGLGVGKNLNVGGLSTLTNTTEASSTTTGALVVSGGVGIGKNLYVGGNTVITGDLEVKGGDITTDQSTFNLLNANASTVNFAGAATELNLGATSGYTTIKNSTTITSVASSINTNSGALVVHGGVGIGQKLFVQSSGTFGGDLLPSANNSYNLGSADYRWKTLYVAAATIDIGGSTIRADNGILLTEKLQTTSTEYSTSTTTGALTVVGGVGVGKNLYIGDTAASTSSVTGNALYVNGGAGVNGSLYVKGLAVFEDDALFLGETVYVFNTNTIYTDNILELHYHEGTDTWTVNDLQDIGFRFHAYSNNTNTNSFLGRINNTEYLEWFGSGVDETNTGTVIGGIYGTFKTGSIILTDTTASNSTQTGALTVAGGVGIGENLNVGGNTTITGDLAVNGGDITSSAASFNLINANVNTLNFVGAGTAITIGSTTGYTNVRNQFTATDTTNATSTSTGALVVHGGVAIKQDTHIGGTITLPNENHSSLSTQVSSTSPTTVDSWSTSTYRTAKYLAQITQGSNYQAAELLVIHDGADAYISEFAIVRTNTNLGTFTADVNTNNVRLRVTMNSATAATIKLSRVLITV